MVIHCYYLHYNMLFLTWPSLNSSKQIAQTGAELQVLAESPIEACR